jgi:superfamily II DNA/RNA helicase
MSAWSDLMLPQMVLRGLYEKGFYEPMPIQKLVIPVAIKNKSNIIGTAQTVITWFIFQASIFTIKKNKKLTKKKGSGKTLAFGLPILTHLIDSFSADLDDRIKVPQALILTPTRELAIQIKDHLQTCCKYQKTKVFRFDVFE